MLPFDNKSEFQVIIDMDEGTTLEQTARVAREIAAAVRHEPEVTDYEVYVGTAAPYNFNGLVRHYFLRRGPNVADIQVNLVGKHERHAQSHEIAKRVRPEVQAIAAKFGARVKIAEVPPVRLCCKRWWPRFTGRIIRSRSTTRARCCAIFQSTPGVVDADWYMEAEQPNMCSRSTHEKAALNGMSAPNRSRRRWGRARWRDGSGGLRHAARKGRRGDRWCTLPVAQRSRRERFAGLAAHWRCAARRTGTHGTRPARGHEHFCSDLMRVVFVTRRCHKTRKARPTRSSNMNKPVVEVRPENPTTRAAVLDRKPAMKWNGKWHITSKCSAIWVRRLRWWWSDLCAGGRLVPTFKTPLIIMARDPFWLRRFAARALGRWARFSRRPGDDRVTRARVSWSGTPLSLWTSSNCRCRGYAAGGGGN